MYDKTIFIDLHFTFFFFFVEIELNEAGYVNCDFRLHQYLFNDEFRLKVNDIDRIVPYSGPCSCDPRTLYFHVTILF